jgi:hypothetical protein
MASLKYCSFLMIVILSNAAQQYNTSDGEYEYEEPELDYYSDEDYKDWKLFPGRKFFFNYFLFTVCAFKIG